jgi:putative DNA primase/helicase
MNEAESIIAKNFALLSDSALAYARNGWRVHPLRSETKESLIKNWPQVASCDPAQVTAWWTANPDSNIGLVLDGLVCIDVDPRHGGLESLAALEAEHGKLDPRVRARTGGNGWHYMYRSVGSATTAGNFKNGLDFLTGSDHYILVEPSIHPSGGVYRWNDDINPLKMHRNDIPLVVPPAWILDAAKSKKLKIAGSDKKTFALPDEIGEGQRQTVLTSAAGKMRRASFSQGEILAALETMNQERCKPPLVHRELESIARSIKDKKPAPIDEDAGLTKALATAITSTDHFARDAGGMLYAWQDGVYRPTGQRVIERRVKGLCEEWERTKSWSPELAARVEQWILVDAPELWERPPLDVLNCANGLLNVNSRVLSPHSPEHLSAVQIPVSYDPQAKCPQVDRFIADVFPADTQGLPFEIAAWLALPDTSIQKAVLLLGEGANGKSVWLNLLQTFLGRENVSALSLHRLEADKFAASRLVGKLANIGTDLPTAALASTSMFKALTGGDSITAERKFEASFEFTPFVRLLFSANSAPRSDDSTHGFFRRWLCVPFNRTFDESDPDTVPRAVLDARLSEPGELSGLLNRALDALPAIRKGRFTESASTRGALDEFRRVTDPLALWLDQNTIEHPDAWVPKEKLRSMYGQVCQDNGRPIMPDSQFTGALKRLRPKVETAQRRVDRKPVRVFLGLGLLTQDPEPGLF